MGQRLREYNRSAEDNVGARRVQAGNLLALLDGAGSQPGREILQRIGLERVAVQLLERARSLQVHAGEISYRAAHSDDLRAARNRIKRHPVKFLRDDLIGGSQLGD